MTRIPPAAWRRYDILSGVLFAVLAALVAATFRQYGVTWDEEFHREYGALVHRFYATYFDAEPDLAALHYRNLRLYGGLFDVIGFELNRVLPFGEYETRHLWNAVVGLIGVLGCWKAARLLGGPVAAFWAALLLVLTPAYYGHMFNNLKDVPFAAGYIWSLYYLLKALGHFPRVPVSLAVRLGLAIGATLAIRAGGMILFAYLGGAVGVHLAARSLATRRFAFADASRLFLSVAVVAGVAYAVMLAFWPYAAAQPWSGPFDALAELTHFRYHDTIRFAGESIRTTELPWSYLPRYLLIQLPEVMLALLAIGLVAGSAWLLGGPITQRLRAAGAVLLVMTAAAFPVGYIIAKESIVYDAARHVIFVLPPLACLAGLTLARLAPLVSTLGRPARFGAAAVLVMLVQAPVRAMVALHPYQYVYFNAFVGGLPGAAGRYETDYWAHCYREAVLKLTERISAEAPAPAATGPFLVYVVEPWPPATYFFPDQLVWTREVRKADFGISFTRYDAHTAFAGDPVYVTVERLGTPLCYVFDRRARTRGTATGHGGNSR